MAKRLTQNREAPTMAVVGILGSGKSTIRALVAYHLRHTPRVRLVHVSLWPFDSAEGVVRGILRAILDELGRHVNVLSLVGLTEDYITAIEKTVGGGSAASRGCSARHRTPRRSCSDSRRSPARRDFASCCG
jgi:hypothetical protein